MADRDDKAYFAKLAEQAERYDDMVESMKDIAKMDVNLTGEERNLLSVAYKNVIGSRRSSWRIISNLVGRAENDDDKENLDMGKEYKKKVEKELQDICSDILDLLDTHLLGTVANSEDSADTVVHESYVFYYKMQGDYLRYLAEFTSATEHKEAAENSLVAYKNASDRASSKLKPTHAIRLGLALNFSVFYYEILKSPDRACRLAKHAFDEAVVELDSLSEENYKDSTLIMQLLRDNLTLWTSEEKEDGKGGDFAVQDMEDQETS